MLIFTITNGQILTPPSTTIRKIRTGILLVITTPRPRLREAIEGAAVNLELSITVA